MPEAVLHELVSQTRAAADAHAGRLVGLGVAVPPELAPDGVTRVLQERLARAGLVGVEVSVDVRLGPVRVLRFEFQR